MEDCYCNRDSLLQQWLNLVAFLDNSSKDKQEKPIPLNKLKFSLLIFFLSSIFASYF